MHIKCFGILLSCYMVLLLGRTFYGIFKVNDRVPMNSQFRFKMSNQLVYLVLSKPFENPVTFCEYLTKY